MLNILLIDNDVMVRLFDEFYEYNKEALNKVMSSLQLEYEQIWISQEVRNEFYLKRADRKRQRRLYKVKAKYPFIVSCPIGVGVNEIRLINGIKEEDKGETDAIIQCNKAKSQDRRFNDIHFLTADKNAIKLAKKYFVNVLPYAKLREKHLETGIVLPK